MMKKFVLFPFIAIALCALAVVLISELTAQEAVPAPAPAGPDIISVATADPNLTTLVSALRAAELVDVLKSRGPFTVFAPNNAAFAKLPTGTLDDLMRPENKKKLAALLKNHVARDEIKVGAVESGSIRTLDGNKVRVAKSDGSITFGGATVLVADLEAANGVVHVIDSVVVPD